jgi:hypothetical protein
MPSLFSPPATDPAILRNLPQFEPDYTLGEEYFDPNKNVLRLHSSERDREIRQLLALSMRPYIIPSVEFGNPPAMDSFIDVAIRSIATYESRRKREAIFDRAIAKATLDKAIESIFDTRDALLKVSESQELLNFLREIFMHDTAPSRLATTPLTKKEVNSYFKMTGQLYEKYATFSPDRLADHLLELETLLSLASERVKLQPDSRRNKIAQEFCDAMAHAWLIGTGEIPTFSKYNPRSRSTSPFAQLLDIINQRILIEPVRDPSGFKTYGAKAVGRIKAAYPELAIVRQKPGRS